MPGPGPGLTTLVMESDESLEPGPNLKNGPEEHRPLARRLRHHYGEAAIKLKCDTKIDQDVESEVETLRVLHRPPESVTVQLHPRPHRRLANAVRPTAFGHDLFANIPVIVRAVLKFLASVDDLERGTLVPTSRRSAIKKKLTTIAQTGSFVHCVQ